MFTGLVQAIGQIRSVAPVPAQSTHTAQTWHAEGGRRLTVSWGGLDHRDVSLGDSIALNGACMTVVAFDAEGFQVDVSRESLDRTVGLDQPGPVHLEKAMSLSDRLGGHLVSGHVDGRGRVLAVSPEAESLRFEVWVPAALSHLVADKGSLTVHGVSLTTNTVQDLPDGARVSINLIPHTVSQTILGQLRPGDEVNLEVDLIARQVARVLERLHATQKAQP